MIDHALFRAWPLAGEVRLSTGMAPTPYHVDDGHGLFIAGSADLEACGCSTSRTRAWVRTTNCRSRCSSRVGRWRRSRRTA